MTTADECEVGNDVAKDKRSTVTLEEILKFLSENSKIVFKSQQISEPDLDSHEKVNIARGIFEGNKNLFFSRFGQYLQKSHLDFFKSECNDDNLLFTLSDLSDKLEHKAKTIKNRRFAALQEMSKDTEEGYFSEAEMMKREPNLYEQLVGQYLTDTERRIVSGECGYEPGEGSFSSILLEGIERDRIEQLRKEQKKGEGPEIEDDEDISEESNENEQLFPKIPTSFRKQWGNFDDEDSQPGPSGSDSQKKVKKQKYVTAEERELLREEFVGIMHSKFIEGKDENFDYSTVDDNDQWDDLKQIGQDKEDAYFDDDEDDEVIERMEDDSDDELDLYMKSIQ
ncbi:CCDC97 family protein [Megaselia abdita]